MTTKPKPKTSRIQRSSKKKCECWCICTEGATCSGDLHQDVKGETRHRIVCNGCWLNHIGWGDSFGSIPQNSREPHYDPIARLATVVGAVQRGAPLMWIRLPSDPQPGWQAFERRGKTYRPHWFLDDNQKGRPYYTDA